jgi:ferredoxin
VITISFVKINPKPILSSTNFFKMDITVKITDRHGVTHELEAPTDMGLNMMQIMQAYELAPEGTIGACGGNALCPTCQCYALNDVELPEKRTEEEALLSRLLFVKSNSRLSCQIPVTKALEGLEIEMAPVPVPMP